MTATTMHFGPEWMRTKQTPSRPNPSPPLSVPTTGPAPAGASSYSALVTPASQPPTEKRDLVNPFRYSKEDMLRIYKEGGGKGGLGLEVERWEGIVREVGSDPISIKEMGDAEKKLFAGPLNSEMRRRPSTDYLSLSSTGHADRPKLNHSNTAGGSPMRERIGGFMGRRRDSTDQPQLTLPRKPSQSSLQAPLVSPRDALPSPRTRIGGAGGFDGVLSDSWSVRRRASEGLLKASGRSGDTSDTQADNKAEGIKEEEEENRTDTQGGLDTTNGKTQTDATPVSAGQEQQAQPGQGLHSGGRVPNLTLDTQLQNRQATGPAVGTPVEQASAGPPPGIMDVNSIEWQYLDPQGHVQGPFPSATMQKWYDDGYFVPNLLMRRVSIDKEWMSVGELLQLAGNARLFLTPLPAAPPAPAPAPAPPVFPRRNSLLDSPASGTFGSPYQPVPTRSLLDPYHNGSMAPDSPSSYSAGRFSNDSPDPSNFSARMSNHLYTEPTGPRLGFGTVQHAAESQRRATLDDTLESSMPRPSYASFGPGRANSIDGLGFAMAASAEPSSPFASNFQPVPDVGYTSTVNLGLRANNAGHMGSQPYPANDYMSVGFTSSREGPRLFNRENLGDRAEAQPMLPGQHANGAGVQYQHSNHFSAGHPMPYPSHTDSRSVSSIAELQPSGIPIETRSQQAFSSSSQSPWPPQEPQIRRPGPFDPDYPTTRNTVAQSTITPVQPIQPARSITNNVQSAQSSWTYQASQGIVSDAWGADPNSLTAANLGQHNRQQEQEELQKLQHLQPSAVPESPSPAEQSSSRVEPASQPDTTVESTHTVAEAPQPSQKQRRKTSSVAAPVTQPSQSIQPVQPAQSASRPAVSLPPVAKPPSPSRPTEREHAWATGDTQNGKPAGATLNLREIQEMEAKKQEARKAAERERERAVRTVAANSPTSEEQTTMTWGLLTSQVGSRAPPAAKEPITTSPSNATTPGTAVWTSVPKAPIVKKSMKEIQEEEERRKKLAAKEKETVANAARRAYAESTTKPVSPALVGGAWTTVGASGKTNTVATPAPSRPPPASVAPAKITSTVSTASVPTIATVTARSGGTTPARPPAVPAAVKLAPSTKDDTLPAPSHEFLKWLAESLKGLNSAVHMEEITSMLLSFPLDPDPSTLEIISDLIYANSTTLDGRRFASDFVSRRRADAKGSDTNGATKSLSIAEVVKAQPKPAQNEWGGFKVVNKKKKVSRA